MCAPQEDINQKQQKVFLVVIANTVVHPGTVVIHPCYTPAANRAVVGCGRLDAVALLTFLVH
jgi:hypothetical protein